MSGSAPSGRRYVQALALGLDPEWRRAPDYCRAEEAIAFARAVREAPDVTTFTYSMVGLQAGTDLLLWRLAGSLDRLEEAAAAALGAGVGRWMRVRESLLGIVQGSQYVKKPTPQEQSMFAGERSRYLVVYPFTKSAEWYLLGREARQGIMNEHMRIGHDYPQVRQLLANSFGVDDQDFLVAYETDDLEAFSNLVRDLRATESRRWTVSDRPILVGVHRPLEEALRLLGAPLP
ncbi:MAG TPA: chlorite dismutase family protein [Candidatus Dormibacteraeota bacterium]|nr:chlorite dismutase family protein [Candidatus Dormibacteraeota bacterium]